MRFSISVVLITLLATGFSQSNQAEYLEARRQFSLGNYVAAKLAFQGLSQDRTFGRYASFYYGLSAYKNGEIKLAYDMWRQVQVNFPEWDQQQEVSFWLVNAAFELQRYSAGFRHLEDLPDDLKNLVIRQTIDKLEFDKLKNAFLSNMESKEFATFLARETMKLPYSERDQDLIRQIKKKFAIDFRSEEVNLPKITKTKYAVAAVLPFMFDSVENPQAVLRNSIIWDLYQGMEIARKDLEGLDIEIELFPFDTKKRGEVAARLIQSGQLENADVIVGPLYPGPNEVVSGYATDQKITMINPLSSNSDIIGNNPFSYLFKPSYETQGKVAAEYARKNFTDNKKTFIFYETDRDSLVAKTYLNEIEKDSFFVIRFERMTNESAQQVQKDFTEKYEIRLDTMYSFKEMDSIGFIPGRIVKDRPLRTEGTGTLIRDRAGNPMTEYYEERFKVVEDSIGHIFVASSSNLLANNFISLAEVRNDTIGIVGYDSWLGFSTVSYNQLERLEIAFISPTLFKKETASFQTLEETFIENIGREPGQYHLIGYELLYQLGKLLRDHGKYFQKGLHGDKKIEGKIMYGLQYGQYHDNQIVPMTKLENLKLVNQEIRLDEGNGSED